MQIFRCCNHRHLGRLHNLITALIKQKRRLHCIRLYVIYTSLYAYSNVFISC